MASINDLYDRLGDILNRLSNIDAGTQTVIIDLGRLQASTDATKAAVDLANQSLRVLTNNVVQLVNIARYQSYATYTLSLQTDTVICALEKVTKQTCALLSEAHVQTQLQAGIVDTNTSLLRIAEVAYPLAAIEGERLKALQQQIGRCCPPEPQPPACSYEPCERPPVLQPPKGEPPR
jgi:hypothetical protein